MNATHTDKQAARIIHRVFATLRKADVEAILEKEAIHAHACQQLGLNAQVAASVASFKTIEKAVENLSSFQSSELVVKTSEIFSR